MKYTTNAPAGLMNAGAMLESFRNNAYTLPLAICELIDNAIDARAREVSILHETRRQVFGPGRREIEVLSRIAVVDTGAGMCPEALHRCLALGNSGNGDSPEADRIGRFHMGMTIAGISVARRIEVYSRTAAGEPFLWTYLDLDEVQAGTMNAIPEPMVKRPEAGEGSLLLGKTGTIVVLSGCDRIQCDRIGGQGMAANDQLRDIWAHTGRIFRRFIHAGLRISLPTLRPKNPAVYLHDPLYRMGPTVHDSRAGVDPKAEQRLFERIPVPVPGNRNETADITVCISLLPLAWRRHEKAGTNTFARTRKITENEGISVLRAGREIAYRRIPNLLGDREARYSEIDRWWGCEISFPPELDEYFRISYSKLDVNPVDSVRDKLREVIAPAVAALRREIIRDFQNERIGEARSREMFRSAEQKMAVCWPVMPHTPCTPPPESLDRIASELATVHGDAESARALLLEELKTRPYMIRPVQFPQNILLEPEYLGDQLLLKLNINHPFYLHVLEPLLSAAAVLPDDDATQGRETWEKEVGDAILLMLLTYCKASSETMDALLDAWGAISAAVFHDAH